MPNMVAELFLLQTARVTSVSVSYQEDTGLFLAAVRGIAGEERVVLFASGVSPDRALSNAMGRVESKGLAAWVKDRLFTERQSE